MDTSFSVRSFIDHFASYDQLIVPANQDFAVTGLSILNDDVNPWEREPISGESTEIRIMITLCRLGQPIAKTFTFLFPKVRNPDVTYALNDNELKCRLNFPFTIESKRGEPIQTRLSDLFRLMFFCDIKEVTFLTKQQLIINNIQPSELVEENITHEENVQSLQKILNKRGCFGLNPRLEIEECEFKFNPVSNATGLPSLTLYGEEFKLLLEDSYQFKSARDFRRRIELKNSITVPSELIIRDSSIPTLIKFYEDKFVNISDFNLSEFILNHFLLLLSGTALLKGKEIEWEIGYNTIMLTSSESFTISLEYKNNIITSFELLNDEFLKNHQDSLSLKLNQKLYFFEIGDKEIKKIDEGVVKEEFLIHYLEFLAKKRPLGFSWGFEMIQTNWGINIQSSILWLTNKKELKIYLERYSLGPLLIHKLIKNSHVQVKEQLEHIDPQALVFIAFRTIFYYCCDVSRYYQMDALPQFFQDKTCIEIEKFLYHDIKFAACLESVLVKDAGKLSALLESTPEEFFNWNLSEESPELKYIIDAIRELAYGEIQGNSPFVQDIKLAIESVVERDSL